MRPDAAPTALDTPTPLQAVSAACTDGLTWHSPVWDVVSEELVSMTPPKLLVEVSHKYDKDDKARVRTLFDRVGHAASPGRGCRWSSDGCGLKTGATESDAATGATESDAAALTRLGSCRYTCSQGKEAAARGGRARKQANSRRHKLSGFVVPARPYPRQHPHLPPPPPSQPPPQSTPQPPPQSTPQPPS